MNPIEIKLIIIFEFCKRHFLSTYLENHLGIVWLKSDALLGIIAEVENYFCSDPKIENVLHD